MRQRTSGLAVDELIRLEGVTCAYGAEPVLAGVDLSIGRQQFTGIVGPSGSGKTTLLKVLLGSIGPRRGIVHPRDSFKFVEGQVKRGRLASPRA